MMFPMDSIIKTLLPMMDLSLQEYVQLLGLTFFTACFEGISNRKEWWSNTDPNLECGAPFRLDDLMFGHCYEQILQDHFFTSRRPTFAHEFLEICDLHEAWNSYYANEYLPSRYNMLDGSLTM